MSKEVMRQALEALENSIDLVSQEARNAEELYGKYPSRLARIQGLVAFEVAHEKAITALREALAEQSAQQQEPVAEILDRLEVFVGGLGKAILRELREALAEQPAQQEPVAYGMFDTMLGKGNRMMMVRLDKGQDGCTVPLYTSPPAQRTWVGLTDEERDDLLDNYITAEGRARAIEAKLKEKNT